jgi:hypothetical protein
VVILRPKSSNRSCRFWHPNQKTLHHQFWGQTGRNRHHWFWGQTGRNRLSGFKVKSLTNRPSGFEAKPLINRPSGFEAKPLTNRRLWFWCSTKKPTLLVSTCMVQSTHNVTLPPDRSVTKYSTCATIPVPLHLVSYSCHDPHCYPPCRTYHLHTVRQINAILHMNKIKVVESAKYAGFEFKPWHVNDSSHIKPRHWPLGFSISPWWVDWQ